MSSSSNLSFSATFSSDAGSSYDGSCRFVSSMPQDPLDAAKIEKQRSKLLSLYHATHCKNESGSCPEYSHCQALKRLYKHVTNCRVKGNQCIVPGCGKLRSVWRHSRRCQQAQECQICSVLPERLLSPRVLQKNASRNRHPSPFKRKIVLN